MPDLPSIPDFPPRPEGYDELRLTIVGRRPDPGDDSLVSPDLLMTSGLVEAVRDKLGLIGIPSDQIFVQTSLVDAEDTPVFNLQDILDAIEAPEEP